MESALNPKPPVNGPKSRTAVLNVVGLTSRLLGEQTPLLSRFVERMAFARVRPALPAVTCTAQAAYLTGRLPGDHGIVANGWYNRELAEHHFWKQSNHLVRSEKLWETVRRDRPEFTCAKLFWWFNMYSSANYSITPRPLYPADGRKVFDIYSAPPSIRNEIKSDLGEFPFPNFWGPLSGIASSRWIAESAKWIEKLYRPDLSLVYLPHLDYNLQRIGPEAPEIANDLREIDEVAGNLIAFFEDRGCRVVVLSEYGITPVSRPVFLNRIFRAKGWITIKEELGRELIDLGASRAFAIADHQVAHVYVNDPGILPEVEKTLRGAAGVDRVLDIEGKRDAGLDHERSGDLVVFADERSWFSYYYWEDDARAPDFARCVDIHRKPGFDPAELFFDPEIPFPKLKAARRLLQKKLGFRTLMDLIPLDASLVKGSHGRLPEDNADWPVLIGGLPDLPAEIDATEVFAMLRRAIG